MAENRLRQHGKSGSHDRAGAGADGKQRRSAALERAESARRQVCQGVERTPRKRTATVRESVIGERGDSHLIKSYRLSGVWKNRLPYGRGSEGSVERIPCSGIATLTRQFTPGQPGLSITTLTGLRPSIGDTTLVGELVPNMTIFRIAWGS